MFEGHIKVFDDDKEYEVLIALVKLKRNSENRNTHSRSYQFKTPFQNYVLMRVFEYTSYPSSDARRDLATILKMSPRTVQIWFQNMRQNIKDAKHFIVKKNSKSDEDGGYLDIISRNTAQNPQLKDNIIYMIERLINCILNS